MPRLFIFLVSILCLASTASYAKEPTPDYDRISTLLFPETANWYPVGKMKPAGQKLIGQVKQELHRAYSESKIGKYFESKDCSFIQRVFSDKFSSNFYLHDVNGDGIQDILYTGSTQCAEGNSTIIWFGNKHGYEIKQDIFWNMQTLRIKEGNSVRISSVGVGCCDSTIDDYFVGPFFNLRNEGRNRITKKTELPEQEEPALSFITKSEMVLRSRPEVNDTYNKNASEPNDVAVFGNILSKYLPGCSGKIIGKKTDNQSKNWRFVVLSEQCGPLRTHVPYQVNAGWIDDSTVIETK